MRLKQLEQQLELLSDFQCPDLTLEQYCTPAHLASHVLFTIQDQFDDFDGKEIADLGIGCGHLSIGACLLGAQHVIGFEIDARALRVCQSNIDEFEINQIDLINCDVTHFFDQSNDRLCCNVKVSEKCATLDYIKQQCQSAIYD